MGDGGGCRRDRDSLHETLGFRLRGRSGLELGQAILAGVEGQYVEGEGEQGYNVGAVREFKLLLSCYFQ